MNKILTLLAFFTVFGDCAQGQELREFDVDTVSYVQQPFVSGNKIYFFDPLEGIGVADLTTTGALGGQPLVLTHQKLLAIPYQKNQKATWRTNYEGNPFIFRSRDYGVEDSWNAQVTPSLTVNDNYALAVTERGFFIIENGNSYMVELPMSEYFLGSQVNVINIPFLRTRDHQWRIAIVSTEDRAFIHWGNDMYALPRGTTYAKLMEIYGSVDFLLEDLRKNRVAVSKGTFFKDYFPLNKIPKFLVNYLSPRLDSWNVKVKPTSLNPLMLSLAGSYKKLQNLSVKDEQGELQQFQVSRVPERTNYGDIWADSQSRFSFGPGFSFIFDINRGIARQRWVGGSLGAIEWMVDESLLFFPIKGNPNSIPTIHEIQSHSIVRTTKTALALEISGEDRNLAIVIGEQKVYVIARDGEVYDLGAHSLSKNDVQSLRSVTQPHNSEKQIEFGVPGVFSLVGEYESGKIIPQIAMVETKIKNRNLLFFSLPGQLSVLADFNGNGLILPLLENFYTTDDGKVNLDEMPKRLLSDQLSFVGGMTLGVEKLIQPTTAMKPMQSKHRQWTLVNGASVETTIRDPLRQELEAMPRPEQSGYIFTLSPAPQATTPVNGREAFLEKLGINKLDNPTQKDRHPSLPEGKGVITANPDISQMVMLKIISGLSSGGRKTQPVKTCPNLFGH